MFCKFCGKQIEDDVAFCKYCGGKQTGEGTHGTGRKPDPAKKKKAFLLLGCMGALLLALILAIAVFGGKGGKETPVKKEQSSLSSSVQKESTPESTAVSAQGLVLPDPATYGGSKIKYLNTHEYEGYRMHSYSLSDSDFEMLSEYVQLLEQHGFSLRDAEQGDSEHDICWIFDYTGGEDLELFSLKETEGETPRTDMAVYLSSIPMEKQGTVTVAFCYTDSLSLEDTGERFGGTTSAPAASAAFPDPARYFADWDPEPAELSKDGSDYTVSVDFPTDSKYSDKELETVLTAYMELLESYGLERTGDEEEEPSVFYFFDGGEGTRTVSRYGFDEEPASIVLTYHRTGRALMVHYSTALEVDEDSPRANLGAATEEKATPKPKATATPKPTAKPKATEKPKASSGKADSSSVQIPDFGAFTGIDLVPSQEKTKGKSTVKEYFFKTNEKIVNEYIELLTEKYNFKLREDSDNVIRTVTLDYTGTGSVSTFDVRKQKAVSVYLWAFHTPDTEFHVTYGDGLDYTDTGDRTAQTILRRPEEEGGSGGGGSSDDDDDSTWKGGGTEIKCTKCHGEKTVACGNCDGKGYKEKVVESPNFSGKGVKRETVKEKCYKCSNGQIECPRCHGTGKE